MIKQKLIAKYAKKFASAQATDGSLQGAHYSADGTVVVTNRHILLRIRDAHSLATPVTLHAATGVPIDGEYPNYNKLIPTSCDNEIRITRSAVADTLLRVRMVADVASRINKKVPTVQIVVANGTANLHIKDRDGLINVQAFLGNTSKLDKSTRTLSAEYLHLALLVLAEVGTDIVISLKKPLEPIVVSGADDDVSVLILPYRVTD